MISLFTLLATGFCAIVCSLGGIGFAVWIAKKKEGTFKMFLLGFMAYTMFVLIVRQTAEQIFCEIGAYEQLWLRVLIVAMLTILTEVGGRALTYAIFLKENTFLQNGLMFGAGYSWTEAVLSVGVTVVYLTGLGVATYRQPEILAQTLDEESAAMLYEQLKNIQGGQMLLTCLNRVLTMALQTAIGIILLAAVARHKMIPALEAALLQGCNAAALELLSGVEASSAVALTVLTFFTAVSVWEAIRLSVNLKEETSESGNGQIWNKRLSRHRL